MTLTAQPVSIATSTYLNGQTGDGTAATFVHNLYRELLGREPDAAGQTYWLNVFAKASSSNAVAQAQRTLVANFLNSSEYHQHLVDGIYTDFLHRAADANGLTFWTAEMAGGMDEKNVLAYILGSQEYFLNAQPRLPIATTPTMQAAAWVDALYRDILGRTADDAGLAYWTRQTVSMDNEIRRTAVALQFLSSSEANQKLLNGNYPGPNLAGLPGTPADGAYALADITGNGWVNLYFQGDLSATVVDELFARLQSGTSFDETVATMLDMAIFFDGRVPPT